MMEIITVCMSQGEYRLRNDEVFDSQFTSDVLSFLPFQLSTVLSTFFGRRFTVLFCMRKKISSSGISRPQKNREVTVNIEAFIIDLIVFLCNNS